MPEHTYFYLALSFMLMHEMDAIRCKEWLIFPILSLLKDRTGFIVFMLAHIPLYYIMFLGLFNPATKTMYIKGLNWFFIIHLGLHVLFLFHPKNEFRDWISWLIIVGAALCSSIDLFL